MTGDDPVRALAALRRVLDPARDILDARVDEATPPAWCEARGWTSFLLGLADDALARCEASGLAAHASALGAPESLRTLAQEVNDLATLHTIDAAPLPLAKASLREVSVRKQAQLGALLGAIGPMAARASRIVDVGAGSGHLTRLAADAFAREAVGIERSADRVAAAEARARSLDPARGTARFVEQDALAAPIDLRPSDLAIGLHACGALGDTLVLAARDRGSDLALVSCCLQKIPSPSRAPLSRAAEGLVLRREILGLTNLTSAPEGVEVSIEATIAAREARFGLRRLLRARGVPVAPGEEMRGVNRRRSRKGLAEIAAHALAMRGLAAPSAEEIERHAADARRDYGVVRRLSLPRSMLARLVEIGVVLDRASALAERGAHVRVAILAPSATTPRNIAIFASGEAARLPAVSSRRAV
jgi:SAM-dependent methyltransferase